MIIVQSHDRHGVPLGELENVSNVSRSFQLNHAGTLTFELPVTDEKATLELIAYNNVIIVYSDESGTWSGYISAVEWSGDKISVTVTGIEARLGLRRATPIKFKDTYVGEIVSNLLALANRRESTGLYLGDLFIGGNKTQVSIGAENIYDKMVEVVETAKLEYRITLIHPGLWEFGLYETIGTDLTDKVAIVLGYDTDGVPSYREDWTAFANSILAVGKAPDEGNGQGGGGGGEEDDGWTLRPKATYEDQVSINVYGLSEDVLDISDVSDAAVLLDRATSEVNKRKYPTRTLSFSLTERRDLWGQFQEGDIICVLMPNYGFTGMVVPFKVLGREISEDHDTMTVAGEILEGERASTLKMFLGAHYGTGGGSEGQQTGEPDVIMGDHPTGPDSGDGSIIDAISSKNDSFAV